MNQIKHASIVPLIGGFPIALSNVTKRNPEAIFSFKAFYENDKLYLRYLQNRKNYCVPYFQIDSDKFKLEDVEQYKNLDIISGTPPCAGLSMSGTLKKGERSNSPVNDWMMKAADFVMGVLTPKVYIFENAPTLYTDIGEPVRNQLIELAKKNGYAITFYKTDTLLHGIPQRRPRTYVVMVKGEFAPLLNYEKVDTPSVEEYFKSIPKDSTCQNMYATKEPFIENFEIVRFCKLKFGDQWRQFFLDTKEHLTSYDFLNRRGLLEEYQAFVLSEPNPNPSSVKDIAHVIKKTNLGKNFRLSHRVLCIDKHHVYAVIGEMMERNVHPTEDRRINMREYMHLMGMPHDFELEQKEIGKLPQNVPTKTSEYMINEIIAVINNERPFSNKRFEMQDNIKYNTNETKILTKKLF